MTSLISPEVMVLAASFAVILALALTLCVCCRKYETINGRSHHCKPVPADGGDLPPTASPDVTVSIAVDVPEYESLLEHAAGEAYVVNCAQCGSVNSLPTTLHSRQASSSSANQLRAGPRELPDLPADVHVQSSSAGLTNSNSGDSSDTSRLYDRVGVKLVIKDNVYCQVDKEEGDNGVGDVNEYELVLNDDNHSASFRPVPSGSSVTDEDMYEGIVVVSGGLCSCMPRRGNAPPLPHTLAAHSTHRASPHLAPGVLPSSCFTARGRQLDGRDDGVRCVDEAGMPSRLSLTSVVYDTIVNGSSGGVDSGLYCCVGVAANSSAAAGQPFAPSAGGDVREPVTGGPVNPVTLEGKVEQRYSKVTARESLASMAARNALNNDYETLLAAPENMYASVDGCCSGDGVVQTVSMRSSSDNDGQRLEGHQKIYAEIEATSSADQPWQVRYQVKAHDPGEYDTVGQSSQAVHLLRCAAEHSALAHMAGCSPKPQSYPCPQSLHESQGHDVVINDDGYAQVSKSPHSSFGEPKVWQMLGKVCSSQQGNQIIIGDASVAGDYEEVKDSLTKLYDDDPMYESIGFSGQQLLVDVGFPSTTSLVDTNLTSMATATSLVGDGLHSMTTATSLVDVGFCSMATTTSLVDVGPHSMTTVSSLVDASLASMTTVSSLVDTSLVSMTSATSSINDHHQDDSRSLATPMQVSNVTGPFPVGEAVRSVTGSADDFSEMSHMDDSGSCLGNSLAHSDEAETKNRVVCGHTYEVIVGVTKGGTEWER